MVFVSFKFQALNYDIMTQNQEVRLVAICISVFGERRKLKIKRMLFPRPT
jgi:hypothetical protein